MKTYTLTKKGYGFYVTHRGNEYEVQSEWLLPIRKGEFNIDRTEDQPQEITVDGSVKVDSGKIQILKHMRLFRVYREGLKLVALLGSGAGKKLKVTAPWLSFCGSVSLPQEYCKYLRFKLSEEGELEPVNSEELIKERIKSVEAIFNQAKLDYAQWLKDTDEIIEAWKRGGARQ